MVLLSYIDIYFNAIPMKIVWYLHRNRPKKKKRINTEWKSGPKPIWELNMKKIHCTLLGKGSHFTDDWEKWLRI